MRREGFKGHHHSSQLNEMGLGKGTGVTYQNKGSCMNEGSEVSIGSEVQCIGRSSNGNNVVLHSGFHTEDQEKALYSFRPKSNMVRLPS